MCNLTILSATRKSHGFAYFLTWLEAGLGGEFSPCRVLSQPNAQDSLSHPSRAMRPNAGAGIPRVAVKSLWREAGRATGRFAQPAWDRPGVFQSIRPNPRHRDAIRAKARA